SKILENYNLKSKQYLVATLHRPKNTDSKENLGNIVDALCEAEENIILPLHPRTEKKLKEYDLYKKLVENVKLIKPLGYIDFMKLMIHSKKILTDSGGVQKEAYMLKVPCITLRENTEWIDTVGDGWNILVGSNRARILKMIKEFNPEGKQKNVFGDGDASKRIVEIISKII
ncbi:MAG: UDP-N-acetylglucosamine 2-epimerase, partial [Halobacteriota archaeon]|nr:UDP-N-acetylglucosamine 2-epimerase [Halobacteriota archaeon]